MPLHRPPAPRHRAPLPPCRQAKLPQTLISMFTKKVAGAILSLLVREAQRVSAASQKEAAAGASADGSNNPYLRRIEQRQAFYASVRALVQKYFDLFGEDASAGH